MLQCTRVLYIHQQLPHHHQHLRLHHLHFHLRHLQLLRPPKRHHSTHRCQIRRERRSRERERGRIGRMKNMPTPHRRANSKALRSAPEPEQDPTHQVTLSRHALRHARSSRATPIGGLQRVRVQLMEGLRGGRGRRRQELRRCSQTSSHTSALIARSSPN